MQSHIRAFSTAILTATLFFSQAAEAEELGLSVVRPLHFGRVASSGSAQLVRIAPGGGDASPAQLARYLAQPARIRVNGEAGRRVVVRLVARDSRNVTLENIWMSSPSGPVEERADGFVCVLSGEQRGVCDLSVGGTLRVGPSVAASGRVDYPFLFEVEYLQ
jgi:hypothetical protein